MTNEREALVKRLLKCNRGNMGHTNIALFQEFSRAENWEESELQKAFLFAEEIEKENDHSLKGHCRVFLQMYSD